MREHEEKRTEAQEIDLRIAELMAPGEDAGRGKKREKGRSRARLLARWKRMSRRKKILAAAGILAVFVLAGRAAAGGEKAGVLVTVTPLAKKDIQEKLSLTGPVSGTDSVDVVSNIHAEITEMHVKEGDAVTKNQVLAVLDSTDLAREVEIARNTYELAVANKEEKDKEAALGYEKAVQDYQKASPLFDQDVYQAISLETCVEGRTSYGGPAPSSVLAQADDALARLNQVTF